MEKPTKPGFYWVKQGPNWEPEVVRVVEREMSCDGGTRPVKYLTAFICGSEIDDRLNDVDAGPGFEDAFKCCVGEWEWLCEATLPTQFAK